MEDMNKSTESNVESYDTKWNFCTTMRELLLSEDFERCFSIVVNGSKLFNQQYYIWILSKINRNEQLEQEEIDNFILFLDNKKVIEISEKVFSKLKWFTTIEEVKEFLKQYSVKNIIGALKEKTQKNILQVTEWKAVEIIKNENWILILRMFIDWKYKYCYKKEGEKIKKEDFIFDWGGNLQEINWEMYYRVILWRKEWYIQLWEEHKLLEKYPVKNIIKALKEKTERNIWEVTE
jgi:hypothetical protein